MSSHLQHQHLTVAKTAHYSTYGTLTKKTKYIWIVMHGYGQLAKYMIRKFDVLDPDDHFVIAPEGLNRFYWHSNNQPVACWMTKEDRYHEINDYCSYLDQLYAQYVSHVNQAQVKVVVMGFSQGSATMYRWLHARQPQVDLVINYAGWIPEDIAYGHLSDYLSGLRQFLYYGDQDELLNDEQLNKVKSVIETNQLEVKLVPYVGGHKLLRENIKRIVADHL